MIQFDNFDSIALVVTKLNYKKWKMFGYRKVCSEYQCLKTLESNVSHIVTPIALLSGLARYGHRQ